MHWLLIAIWAPLLWAFSNHIDKYLITKYGEGAGIRGLITFSSLCSLFVVIFAFFINPNIFSIDNTQIYKLILSGLLYSFSMLAYLFALSEGEASNVTPVFQLIPVFAFLLGFFYLGETLLPNQLWGGLIVIIGAIIISMDFKQFKFNRKAFFLMFFSSLMIATDQILFKSASIGSFWVLIFWQALGSFTAGLIFFAIKKYRSEFISIFKQKTYSIIWWSFLVEVTTMGGNLLVLKAITLAPSTALVLLVEAFQPIFVFGLGFVFTLYTPLFAKETIDKKALVQKFIAIGIIILGSYFLYF